MGQIKNFVRKAYKSNDPTARLHRFLIHFVIYTVIVFIALRIILGESREKLAAMEEALNSAKIFPF